MGRYLTELVGTGFLVLTTGLTAGQGEAMAPLAIGAVLVALVYLGGHLSGAHHNPGFTLAILLAGSSTRREAIGCVVAAGG